MNAPPSMTTVWPVIHDDRSLARNSAALAMSCGSPSRRNGIRFAIAADVLVQVARARVDEQQARHHLALRLVPLEIRDGGDAVGRVMLVLELAQPEQRTVVLAHVHDLVRRIDLVLAEAEKGRLGLERDLRDVRERLRRLEERLAR